MARSFTLSRDEVVLALGFTQSVADLLTPPIKAPSVASGLTRVGRAARERRSVSRQKKSILSAMISQP